ncbi:MAG: hypothetical protein QOJ56_3629, partial [Mycobacterium sp.]|nr:hypothetical protein [Mycobacterium sp.]
PVTHCDAPVSVGDRADQVARIAERRREQSQERLAGVRAERRKNSEALI